MDEDTGLDPGTAPDDDPQQDDIELLQERARAKVRAVRLALESLLRTEGRPNVREAALPALWRERDQALRALGLAVLGCELEDSEGLPPKRGTAELPAAQLAPARPVEAPAPPAVPLSPPPRDGAVSALSDHFAGGWSPAPAAAVPKAPPPWMALADAEPPKRPLDIAGAIGELRMLERELQRLEQSTGGSPVLRGLAVDCIVARARVLQQEWCQQPVEASLQGLFSGLTRYVAEAGLAYIVGLKRDHQPPAGTWRAEIKERTARLQREVYGPSPAAQAVAAPRPARPSRAARKVATPVLPAVPAEVLALTQGNRGVVVGGDDRGKTRERVCKALGLEALDWESGKNMRRVISTARRLENGHYAVVIVLQKFISHKVTRKVLPAVPPGGKVVCAFVKRGYGVDAVVRAVVNTVEGREA